MGRSVYFRNCIREIRQTVYGRDMRKPIADAVEMIRHGDDYEDRTPWMEELTERIEGIPHHAITDVNAEGPGVVDYILLYKGVEVEGPDNVMTNLTGRLSTTLFENDDYSVRDYGTSSASHIENDDYSWDIEGSGISEENIKVIQVVGYLVPVYNDDYTLNFSLVE